MIPNCYLGARYREIENRGTMGAQFGVLDNFEISHARLGQSSCGSQRSLVAGTRSKVSCANNVAYNSTAIHRIMERHARGSCHHSRKLSSHAHPARVPWRKELAKRA
jgi:hypothetical protein